MGGDGGGNDYQAKQQATEASKQLARDALNAQFGIGDATTLDRSKFTKKGAPAADAGWIETTNGDQAPMRTYSAGSGSTPDIFDQAGYDAELASLGSRRTGREGLYQTVRDNTFAAGKRSLDEQRDEAARKTKFELFAKGLNGGSEDIDQNALLGRTYQQGIMDLGARADAAKANFRGNDETTRLGLLQSIDAGMDQGSALSSAINQMQNTGDKAAAEAQGTNLGDLFANGAFIYNKSQAAQGRQAGTEWWNTYKPASGSGSKSVNGMITGVQ